MQDFRLSTYGYPALNDLATLRIAQDAADKAEEWLRGQDANVLQSKNIDIGRTTYGSNEQPIRVITFQDQAPGRPLIDFLRDRPNAQEDFYRHRPKALGEGLKPQAYDYLTNLKHRAAAPDFLTDLMDQVPAFLNAPGEAIANRIAYNQVARRSTDVQNASQRAYDQLKGLSANLNVPVHELDTESFSNALGQASGKFDVDKVGGFYLPSALGSKPGIFIHDKPGFTPYHQAQTLAHELGHALSIPGHTVPWSRGRAKIEDFNSPRIHEVHAEPIGYGLMRQVMPDSIGPQLRTLEYLSNTVGGQYRGSYGPTRSVANYLSSPDYQNQIRSAVKFAGRFLA
jgi:hypothetical protein